MCVDHSKFYISKNVVHIINITHSNDNFPINVDLMTVHIINHNVLIIFN